MCFNSSGNHTQAKNIEKNPSLTIDSIINIQPIVDDNFFEKVFSLSFDKCMIDCPRWRI